MLAETTGVSNTLYTYDANGNTLAAMKDGTLVYSYTYGLFGTQDSYTSDAILYTYYTYRPDGLRHSIGDTVHVWDGANIVADVEGNDITTYFRGINLIYAEEDGEQTYYHFNAHGDVVVLTNESGEKEKTYSYTSFGIEYNSSTFDTNPFRYCGEYYDAVSGTIYLRARYYNAELGRFTQEDPIRDGRNWYAYCGNNPIMFVDPSGNVTLDVNQRRSASMTYFSNDTGSSVQLFRGPQNGDFDVWNSKEYKNYTNCYAYAFDLKRNPLTGEKFPNGGLQPGMFATNDNVEYDVDGTLVIPKEVKFIKDYLIGTEETNSNLIELIQKDMKTIGLNFQKYEKGMVGGYRVALVLDGCGYYHWFRENGDGTWSHKNGTNPASNRVEYEDAQSILMEVVITDPKIAGEKMGCNIFVGYFYVSP